MKMRVIRKQRSSNTAKYLAVLVILGSWLVAPATGLGAPMGGSVEIIFEPTGEVVIEEPGNDEAPGPNPNVATVNVPIGGLGNVFKLFPFQQGGPAAATEVFVEETIVNLIPGGVNIVDYHMELGWWVGGAFVPSVAGDGFDFDWGASGPSNTPPPTGTALTFSIDNISNEDVLDWFGPPNILPSGNALLTFSVDVPSTGPSGTTHWAIRQFATVPEPSTFGMLATALLLLVMVRYRVARQNV